VALTPLEVIHFTADSIRELIAELPAFESALDEVAKSRLG
jgi:CRP-like cAMP-binding protein